MEGELFSWGKKLHVCDRSDKEVAYVEQQLFTFRPRYAVYVRGARVGEVVKEFSIFRPHYVIEGLDWDVEGDCWSHDYTVFRHGNPIVTIQKQWFTWGDCYVLDIRDPADELQALALVLAIDCAIERQSN